MSSRHEQKKKKTAMDKLTERLDHMEKFLKEGLGFDTIEVKNIHHVLYMLRMTQMKQFELANNLQLINTFLEDKELTDVYNEWLKKKEEEQKKAQDEAIAAQEKAQEGSNASVSGSEVVT